MPADLDAAIDAVAREMTEGEPSAALRAGVLAGIEQGRRGAASSLPRWAWAGAVAGAVIVVAASAWLFSPARNQDAAQATVARQPAAQSAAAPTHLASPELAPPAAAGAGLAVAARGAQTAASNTAQDFSAVPALPEIEPLRFAAVEPDPLHIADVEVTQLAELPPIDIPSLDPGSPDLHSTDSKKEK